MSTSTTRRPALEDGVLLLLVCKSAGLAILQQRFGADVLPMAWYVCTALYVGAAWALSLPAVSPRWAQALPLAILVGVSLVAAARGLEIVDLSAIQPPVGGLDWLLLGLCAAVRSARALRLCVA